MGTVYADIILKNSVDISSVKRGYMTEKEIRTVSVTALVDTGAGTLIINESIREKLGLDVRWQQLPISSSVVGIAVHQI